MACHHGGFTTYTLHLDIPSITRCTSMHIDAIYRVATKIYQAQSNANLSILVVLPLCNKNGQKYEICRTHQELMMTKFALFFGIYFGIMDETPQVISRERL